MLNKKGMVAQRLVRIILPLIILLVVIGVLIVKYAPAIASTDSIVDFGDCDNDKIQNQFDKCPCLSSMGVTQDLKELRGCPTGTTINKSLYDQQTCNWFITNDEPKPDCDEDKEDVCKTRCQEVKGQVIEIPEEDMGIATNANLVVKEFSLFREDTGTVSVGGKLIGDMEGKYRSLWVQVNSKITNLGPENVSNSFKVRISVCDKKKQNCVWKSLYSEKDKNSNKIDQWAIDDIIPVNNETALTEKWFLIGSAGDACSAKGSPECWVEIWVDSTNVLGETTEEDNKMGILAMLKDKDFDPSDSIKKYQIAIFSDDGSNGGAYDWFCEECSVSSARTKLFEKWGWHDGDLPTNSPSNGDCWVLSMEDDDPYEDFGAGVVSESFILETYKEKAIPVYNEMGEANAISNFKDYNWKAQTDGGMICHDGSWWWCGDSAEDELLLIDGSYFICKNNNWIAWKMNT
jgi:hypothetical protein